MLTADIEAERNRLVAELERIRDMPDRHMIPDTGVLERWNRYAKDLEAEADQAPIPSIAGPVFERAGHTALKLTLLLAYPDGERITLPHLLASIEITERWRVSSYGLLSAIGPTRQEEDTQRVLDLVRRKPGIKRGQVMASLRLSAREMDGIERTLVEREAIAVQSLARGSAYVRPKRLNHHRLQRLKT